MDFKKLDNYKLTGEPLRCPFCGKEIKVQETDEVWEHGELGTYYKAECSCLHISYTDSMYKGYQKAKMYELVKIGYIKKITKILNTVQRSIK